MQNIQFFLILDLLVQGYEYRNIMSLPLGYTDCHT